MVELLIGVGIGVLVMYAVSIGIVIKVFWKEVRGKY